MLINTLLLDFKIDENKNRKNAALDFSHSSENNSSNKNLSKTDNTSDETFSKDKNKEELISLLKKIK